MSSYYEAISWLAICSKMSDDLQFLGIRRGSSSEIKPRARISNVRVQSRTRAFTFAPFTLAAGDGRCLNGPNHSEPHPGPPGSGWHVDRRRDPPHGNAKRRIALPPPENYAIQLGTRGGRTVVTNHFFPSPPTAPLSPTSVFHRKIMHYSLTDGPLPVLYYLHPLPPSPPWDPSWDAFAGLKFPFRVLTAFTLNEQKEVVGGWGTRGWDPSIVQLRRDVRTDEYARIAGPIPTWVGYGLARMLRRKGPVTEIALEK